MTSTQSLRSRVNPKVQARFWRAVASVKKSLTLIEALTTPKKMIYQQLKGTKTGANKKKRIIELDIKKCFDRISHEAIMKNVIAPQGIKLGIFRSLKAGVFPEFPKQGAPQGGVCALRCA